MGQNWGGDGMGGLWIQVDSGSRKPQVSMRSGAVPPSDAMHAHTLMLQLHFENALLHPQARQPHQPLS